MACDLIPGILDDIALHCLASLPLASHKHARAVCRAWRSALLTDYLYQVRRCKGLSEQWLYVQTKLLTVPWPMWKAYDPLSQHWHSLPPLPTQDFYPIDSGMAASSKRLFVIGGERKFVNAATRSSTWDVTGEVWAWDPIRGEWEQRAPMLVAKYSFACCEVEGKIVVAGGHVGSTNEHSSSVQIYDPEEDRWSYGADLKLGGGYCWGLILQGKMHVVHIDEGVEVFDPSQNCWTAVECSLDWCTTSEVNGELYILESGRLDKDGKLLAYRQRLDQREMGVAASKSNLYVFGGFLLELDDDSIDECIIINVPKKTISEAPDVLTVWEGCENGIAVLSL